MRGFILACLVLGCCFRAGALDPSLDVSQYAHTSWKIRDGFSKGSITSIGQTPDGYLWLGTELGLLRFDGIRAVPWSPPGSEQLPSNIIRSLLVARDGTLWISTMKGLASWKDGKFTVHGEVTGLPENALLEANDGTIWFGIYEPSKGRLCAFRGGKIGCQGEAILGDGAYAPYQDRRGNIWTSATTGLWRWSPGPPERYAYPRGTTLFSSLFEDDAGALMLAAPDGVKRFMAGRIESYPLPGITGQFRVRSFLRSRDGSLWISTDQGLLHQHQGRVDGFRAIDGLSGDSVWRIFEDREGNIWVGTAEGLDRFREFPIPTISQKQGLSGTVTAAVQATPDGSIWINTVNGIDRWANGHMTVYRSRIPLDQGRRRDDKDLKASATATEIADSGLVGPPQTLGLDNAGRLWASTTEGIFYFEHSRFVRVPGVPGGVMYSIAGDGHGNVWILHGTAGLFKWYPTAAIQQIPRSQFGQKAPVTLLPDQEPGGLWVGFGQGGITYLKDGKLLRSYGAGDGLGDGKVNQLRFGSRGGLWAATGGGLSRVNRKDGHIETLSSKNGLPCDAAHWSMEDDDHAVWVYMRCGLVRIEGSEWSAWVDDPRHVVKTTIFDTSDGVRSVGATGGIGPLVTKSADGRIWFWAHDGVSVIDPRHLPVNKLPPPVHIEQITVDDQAHDAAPGLRLPPHARDVEISYTALSLVDPAKVRFRYKLEGFNRNWHDDDQRKVHYANLPPGNYTFRVLASNNSGVWNEAGAALKFSVLPAFYQTIWFRALCILGFLALFWGIYQFRLQQLERQFNIGLEARVNERMRIARELHDTLLQNFHGVMFQLQAVLNLMPRRPEEARRSLAEAIDQTEKAIAEGRDAIQGLRSQAMAKGDLAELLMAASQDLAKPENAEPVFELIEEGERQTLSSASRDEICRIALELLRNAYRHAQAHRIEAEIRYEEHMFRLRIRDDGKGMEPKLLQEGEVAGHFGLRGIRERAQRIGATLDFWTEVGAGTETQLTVPASVAYENPSYRKTAS